MKKLLCIGLMSMNVALISGKDMGQKNYKELLQYFTLNSQAESSLKGIMPKINCTEIEALSQKDFYSLLDTIDKSYECGTFDYLESQDGQLCVAKCKELNAIVDSINSCRSIELYLEAQGCSGTEYGICSALFKP